MTTSRRTHEDEASTPRSEEPPDEESTAGSHAGTRALDAALGFGTLDAQSEATTAGPLRTRAPPGAHSALPPQVLSKPRPIGTSDTRAQVRSSGLTRVDRAGRGGGEEGAAVAPGMRTGTPNPGPASAPRPLIRPAARAPAASGGPVEHGSQRSLLDRPAVHSQARPQLTERERDVLDAPLVRGRDEATRAATEPRTPALPDPLSRHEVARGEPQRTTSGDEMEEAPAYEHTVRGFTRQQLGELASARVVSTGHATGIEPGQAEPPVSAAVAGDPKFEVQAPGAPAPPSRLSERALFESAQAASRTDGGTADPREREIRARAVVPDATLTALRPAASQILPKVSAITLVLLFQAVALPTAAGAPWELLARPAEVTLQALAALVLVAVVHLLPCRERTRGVLGALLGALLLPFAFVAWRAAITAGVFDAQPALSGLFSGSLPTPALPALLALVLLPAGLFARGHHASRVATWVLTAAGFAAAVVALATMSLGALVASLSEAAFLGDRVAAWATLPLLVALALGLAAFAWAPLGRRASAFGFLLWGTALLPLVVLALFAAKSDQWLQVLEPIKLVTFLGAITLYTAAALATAVNRRVRDL